MQEAEGFTVGGPTTTVEIDETYVGGRKRLQSLKAAFASKTAVVGLAERDGKIHLQTMKSVTLDFTRTTVKERLSPETPKVVTDGKQLYKGVIPRVKHERGNHKVELRVQKLDIDVYGRERILTLQARNRRHAARKRPG